MNLNLHKKIFVTGGTGFLGSYLLRYLVQRGYTNLRALKRPSSSFDLLGETAQQIDWVEGDLLDVPSLEEAMHDVDLIFHCAALVSFIPKDKQKMMLVNGEGTANIVNVALYRNVEKLIYVSSVAAIGKSPNKEFLNEDDHWVRGRHNTSYSISKYIAEQEVWRGMAEGLKVAVVNPSIILGSGNWEDGPLKMFKLIWKNFAFYTGGVSGFVDVRDVARYLLLLMEEEEMEGQRYILNGENLPIATVQKQIAKALEKRVPRIKIRNWASSLLWRIAWLQSLLTGNPPFLTRETVHQAITKVRYDNSKSVEDLDFSYTPIEQTIAETASQFREASKEDFTPKVLPLL